MVSSSRSQVKQGPSLEAPQVRGAKRVRASDRDVRLVPKLGLTESGALTWG